MVPPTPNAQVEDALHPRVLVAVWKPYQAKVFPNAGPMAKSKGKVDKGTGSAELINKKTNSITYLTFQVATTLLVVL